MAKKTISGARAKRGQRSNGCNPRHNNRDYQPSNADPARQHLNVFYAESTKSVSLEQIYEKLFQASYEEWLKKEHAKGRQLDAPEKYLDKIRIAGDKKRDQYEIIWQFGDMKNTGWKTNRGDFMRSRQLLNDFAERLLSLPYITVVTPERLADPTWQPPFEDGLIVTNLALHGDENTPQLHMDFIPYSRSKKRGQSIQNAYAAAFKGMGYEVVETPMMDPDTGEVQYKKDKDGNDVLNKNGERVPIMLKTSFGSIDWIEEQKSWLQQEMEARYGWEREYKGKNKFGDVSISEFVAEDNLRQAQEQEARRDALLEENRLLISKNVGLTATRNLLEAEVADLETKKKDTDEKVSESITALASYESRITALKEKTEEYEERLKNADGVLKWLWQRFKNLLSAIDAFIQSIPEMKVALQFFRYKQDTYPSPEFFAASSEFENFEREQALIDAGKVFAPLDAVITEAEALEQEIEEQMSLLHVRDVEQDGNKENYGNA